MGTHPIFESDFDCLTDRMSVAAGTMFKWLDLLEREFDRSFVTVDLLLGEVDAEQSDITSEGRDKLGVISSCFSQLCHKAQTLAQMNAKLEAEILNVREDLFSQIAEMKSSKDENEKLILEFHKEKLNNLKSAGFDITGVEAKMQKEIDEWQTDRNSLHVAHEKAKRLELENTNLRRDNLALQDDLFGARLASKYLDKELAGRIQQIQLLGRDIRGEEYEQVWNQLEAEIHLHRHKTVIRACRQNLASKTVPDGHVPGQIGMIRRVVLNKDHEHGLGLAVIGGKQLGVPILVSDVYPNRPAAQSGQVFVGDAILSVNNNDLRNLRHEEAVELLNTQKEQVELELLFVSPAGDEIGQSTPKMNGHYQEPEEEEEEEIETATTECQTDKVEKHVTFEDAISLSDSNLDPPLEDPVDEDDDNPDAVDKINNQPTA